MLLSNTQSLNFEQTNAGLKVNLPNPAPGKSAYVPKIEGPIT